MAFTALRKWWIPLPQDTVRNTPSRWDLQPYGDMRQRSCSNKMYRRSVTGDNNKNKWSHSRVGAKKHDGDHKEYTKSFVSECFGQNSWKREGERETTSEIYTGKRGRNVILRRGHEGFDAMMMAEESPWEEEENKTGGEGREIKKVGWAGRES